MTRPEIADRRQLEELVYVLASDFEEDIERLARACAIAFGGTSAVRREGDTRAGRTQMSNLERAALTARYFGDVIAFVKRQTGKARRGEQWQARAESGKLLGVEIVELLERVQARADKAVEGAAVELHLNELRILLARLCLRNLNSAYLYEVARQES